MKSIFIKLILPGILLSSSIAVSQCTENLNNGQPLSTTLPDLSDTLENEANAELSMGIRYLREEEKLARDVYLFLYEKFPLRPFDNISKSEQAHMDAMKYLLDLYELEDPAANQAEGEFTNAELQELYNELTKKGSLNEVEALKVGAYIEEVDILDLLEQLEHTEGHEELNRVYSNLCRASENHLRAFVRVLGRYSVDYTPVLLSEDQFREIIEY